MRAIIQRVLSAGVSVGGSDVASIGPGLLVLVGVQVGDTQQDAEYLYVSAWKGAAKGRGEWG